MRFLKIALISALCISVSGIAAARPWGHPRPFRPYHYHCHPSGCWWIPATVFTSAVAVSAIASAASERETVIVKEPATTTVVVQQPATVVQQPATIVQQPATTVVQTAPQTAAKQTDQTQAAAADQTPPRKVVREEIKPDGTRILYYE